MEFLWLLSLVLAPAVGALVTLWRVRTRAEPGDLAAGLARLRSTDGLSDGQRVALEGTLRLHRATTEPEPVAVSATLADGREVRGAAEGLRLALAPPAPTPNQTTSVDHDRLSTFAIDVDTASYAIARRKLREGGGDPEQNG